MARSRPPTKGIVKQKYNEPSLGSDLAVFFTTSASLLASLYQSRSTALSRASLKALWRWLCKAAGMFAALDAVAKASVCFEVLTAFLSVLDIVADALVCHEFHAAGHGMWAYLVMASLLVSSCVYVIVGSDLMRSHRVLGKSTLTRGWSDRRWKCAVLPIAQLVPTIHWAVVSLHESGLLWSDIPVQGLNSNDDGMQSWATAAVCLGDNEPPVVSRPPAQAQHQAATPAAVTQSQLSSAAVVREQCAGASSEFAAMRRAHQEIHAYIRKHFFFLVETLVEAIPQVVIQLLAMTSIGEDPSPLQLFSMAMSLLTIATKLYLVCLTFDLKMFAFKVCLAVMDLFGFFYVFATLLAPRHEDSPTFQPFWLPWGLGFLGAVWVGRSVLLIGLILFVILFIALPLALYEQWQKNNGRFNLKLREVPELVGAILLAVTVGSIMFVPLFFVLDALKFGWLIALDTTNLGAAADIPQRGVQVTFIRGGKTFREQNRRLLAIMEHYTCTGCSAEFKYLAIRAHSEFSDETAAMRLAEITGDGETVPLYRRALRATGVPDAMDTFPLRMSICCTDVPNGRLSELWAYVKRGLVQDLKRGDLNVLMPTLFVSCAIPYFLSQVLLLPLPLANYIVEEGVTLSPVSQNVFQLFCLAVWCAAALGALLLLPAAVPYIRLTMAMFPLVKREGVRPGPMHHLLAFMARTLLPEPCDVLRHTVPTAVVPAVVRDYVVAPFSGGMNIESLTAVECAALRE